MLTTFLIFWPLLAALLLLVIRPVQARGFAFATAVVELAVLLYVFGNFNNTGELQYNINVPWIQSLGVSFAVGMDGISLLLVLLTNLLVPFIILSSSTESFNKSHTFYALVLMMQMALVGVFTALDGFLFYLFWEMALIPIYFICLLWGGKNRAPVTLKFFIYTLAGSLIMLVALVYIYYQTPDKTFAISSLYEAGRSLPLIQQELVFWAFFIAFAIKMPVFPFHTWQPDTYTEAPTQGTMLLSGIMLKMGIYGLIRWLLPLVPEGAQEWGFTAIVLSVIGIVYASAIALVQKDIKRLIAYSSIAHVGLISAGIFTFNEMGMQGAMVQMISHGIVAVALFYVVDIINRRAGTFSLLQLGGIRHSAPSFATVFLIVMLGSIALPFTSGFVGEFLLINSLVQYKLLIGGVAGLTSILGAVYMLRAFQQSMLGELTPTTSGFSDLTSREKAVLYPLVALIILVGVYPAPLLAVSEPAVNSLLSIFSDLTASAR